MPPWKVIPLINSIIEKNEEEEFRIWFQDRARNAENYPLILFEKLLPIIRLEEHAKLNSESCWRLVRPDVPFHKKKSDLKLRQYRSDLKERIERFWLEKALDQGEDSWGRLLKFQVLSERNLYDLLDKAYRLEADKWKGKQILDLKDLFFLFQVQQMSSEPKVKETRIKMTSLPEVIESFIEYSLTTYLKLACIQASEANIISQEYQPIYLKELVGMLDEKNLTPQNGLLYIYFHIYQFLQAKSDEIDHILTALAPDNTTLSSSEISSIYALLYNGIIKRMNIGGFHVWAPRSLALFDWALKAKAILKDNQIDPRLYKNMVVTALRLDRRQVAWDLMEELKKYLSDENQEYYRFCKGYYHYFEKNYNHMRAEDAWSRTVPFKNTVLQLSSQIVRCQAEYEKNWGTAEEIEIFDLKSDLNRIRRFVKSQKSMETINKASWLVRIDFFKRLLKPLNRKGLETLLKEVLAAEMLGNRDWFIYQIKWRLEVME